MLLLLGSSRMDSGDYTGAIQILERARGQTRYHTSETLSSLTGKLPNRHVSWLVNTARNLSQISGWRFDDLDTTVQQHPCDALYAAGRINEASKALINILYTVDEDVYLTGYNITWVSGESIYSSSFYLFDIRQTSFNDVSPLQKAVLIPPSIHHPPRRS